MHPGEHEIMARVEADHWWYRGLRDVVAATADPNPAHAGRGFDILRAAGIGVTTGVLAAEANIAYASVALVTDYDAGVDGHEPVTMEAVLAMVRQNVDNVQRLIVAALAHLP